MKKTFNSEDLQVKINKTDTNNKNCTYDFQLSIC